MKKIHFLIVCMCMVCVFSSCRCVYYYIPVKEKSKEYHFKDNNIYFSLISNDASPYQDYCSYYLRISFEEESQKIENIEVKILIDKTEENLKLKQISPNLSLMADDINKQGKSYNNLEVQLFKELPDTVKNTKILRANGTFCSGAFSFKFIHKEAREVKGGIKSRKYVVLKYEITMEHGGKRQNEIKLKQNRHCFFAVH